MNEINFNKGVSTITSLVEKYQKNGRFTEEMAQNVTNTLDGQELKIVVIGKMKAGKSSLTNALIFHNNVLPSGMEPITATLTEIVYTDDPSKDSKVKVELLSQSDINDLQNSANSENAQISQNAKEILDNINSIPEGYEQYVKKGTVEIDLNELTKYTSTGEVLSGLAKKVTIYKNLDALKGIKITDTPGFNDPVISRGEATRKALKDCHIILFIHDYLDKYDQDEISILLEQVEYSGVSMLVDIINKMDMLEDLSLSQWPLYIPKFDRKKEEAKKQITEEGIKELLSKGKTSYVSALMALIGYKVLDYNQKQSDCIEYHISDDTKESFVKFQRYFSELKGANDFIEYSNIKGIVDIINQLSVDKSKYLESYPMQTLIGYLKSVVDIIITEIGRKQNELSILQKDADEAQLQLNVINETFKALGNKINSPILSNTLSDRIGETKHKIQQLRDSKSTEEFTTSNYEKEGSIFTAAPENRNLARYKGVLADFDNEIRNKLEELKDQFSSECKAYIYKLVEELVTNDIREQDRNMFASTLIELLKSEISKGLVIVVNPDEPTNCLYGAGTQYSLYRTDFLQRHSDAIIEDRYLKIFRSFVDSTISSDVLRNAITEQIEELKAKLKSALKYSPAEKENEVEKINQVIKKLEEEHKDVEKDIYLLMELKKEA